MIDEELNRAGNQDQDLQGIQIYTVIAAIFTEKLSLHDVLNVFLIYEVETIVITGSKNHPDGVAF